MAVQCTEVQCLQLQCMEVQRAKRDSCGNADPLLQPPLQRAACNDACMHSQPCSAQRCMHAQLALQHAMMHACTAAGAQFACSRAGVCKQSVQLCMQMHACAKCVHRCRQCSTGERCRRCSCGVCTAMGSAMLWGQHCYGVSSVRGSALLWGQLCYGVSSAMGSAQL